MAKFVNIKGVGDLNVDHVVMIVKGMGTKYEIKLSHGGKIFVSKSVRDKIVGVNDVSVGNLPAKVKDDSKHDKSEVNEDE